MTNNNYDSDRPWTKQTFYEDYELLTKEIKPRTNYQAFLEHMTPDMLALLLAENRCTNTCICCSEMDPYDKPGNASCDLRCIKHTLDYLNQEYSEEIFNRVLRFFYIPKEEVEEC